jgi:MYXO-CTERM domain-containing protein
VFHLAANGTLDRAFGIGGLWLRPGDADPSSATSLAASSDGLVAVAVAVRGARPGAELWQLTDVAPTVLQRQPLDVTNDGEDLRASWATDHWALSNGGGPTGIVPAALLTNRTQAAAAAASAASADPGQGGFNPFVSEAASAPAATPEDDGLPWTWIAIAAVLLAAVAGAFLMRVRRPQPALRKP